MSNAIGFEYFHRKLNNTKQPDKQQLSHSLPYLDYKRDTILLSYTSKYFQHPTLMLESEFSLIAQNAILHKGFS